MEPIRSIYLCWQQGDFRDVLLGCFKDHEDAKNLMDHKSEKLGVYCFVTEERVIY